MVLSAEHTLVGLDDQVLLLCEGDTRVIQEELEIGCLYWVYPVRAVRRRMVIPGSSRVDTGGGDWVVRGCGVPMVLRVDASSTSDLP